MKTQIEISGFPAGKQLRILRQVSGLSLDDLAQRLGSNTNRLSRLERGYLADDALLARALDVIEGR